MADQGLWPENTKTAGHIACETPFAVCSDSEECDVEDLSGSKVPLQRICITLPAGEPPGPVPNISREYSCAQWLACVPWYIFQFQAAVCHTQACLSCFHVE